MKSKKSSLLVVFTIIFFLIGVLLYVNVMKTSVFEFDLNAYQRKIDMFPSDKVLGPIQTTEEAKKKLKRFGRKYMERKL